MGIGNADVLEKVFARLSRASLGISLLLQHEHHFNAATEIQTEIACVYADLLELVCRVAIDCGRESRSKAGDFSAYNVDSRYRAYSRSFATRRNRILESMWKIWGESHSYLGTSDINAVRQFLDVQDRTLKTILEVQTPSRAESTFEWFDSYLTSFAASDNDVLYITANPGCGKSVLSQWITERLHMGADHVSWDVIPYAISESLEFTDGHGCADLFRDGYT